MQLSVNKKLKHRNCFKIFKIASPSSLFQRASGINVPNVEGVVDCDERLIDSIHRTNQELNSEAYDYYAKCASEEQAQQNAVNELAE